MLLQSLQMLLSQLLLSAVPADVAAHSFAGPNLDRSHPLLALVVVEAVVVVLVVVDATNKRVSKNDYTNIDTSIAAAFRRVSFSSFSLRTSFLSFALSSIATSICSLFL